MGKTKFVQVSIKQLPKKDGKYLCRVTGYSNYEYYEFKNGKFNTSFDIDEYLLEVPDREDEMRELLEEIFNDLKEDPTNFPTGYYFEKLNNYLTN